MGNSGACCSSGTGADAARCCGAPGGAVGDGAPSPVDPLRDEVKGIDATPAPGMGNQELAYQNDSGTYTKEPAAPEYAEKKELEEAEQKENGAGDDASQERQFVTYQDGSTYTGLIKEGKRHGNGIWQSKNCQYEGQWKADAQDGQGRQTWSDGRVYDGQFQSGRFSGSGKMVWHTQKGLLVYEGQYKDDLKHGHGKFVWPDGRTYDGEWSQGKRHGRGTYITAKAERKVGYWVDDKFDRWENTKEDEAPAYAAAP